MSTLTIKDLQPGRLYRVVDNGDADPQFKGAVVVGCDPHYKMKAVTIWTPVNPSWVGAAWGEVDGDDDSAARFFEISRPVF